MQGGREDVPMAPTAGGIGGMMPPQGGAPMPPPQGGAPMPPSQGGMPSTMAEQMPMQEEMPMEEPVSIEQDAAALAEAVIGRAGGDPQAAVAILDTAAQMIMQTTQEEPMMAAGGGYMKKPRYAANGEYLGEESDLLRQMIMDDMQTSVDKTRVDANLEQLAKLLAQANAQQGRTISDKDLEFHKQMLMDSMTEANMEEDSLQPLYDELSKWGTKGKMGARLIEWNQNRLGRQAGKALPASPMDERVEAHLARMDRDPASFATDSVSDMFDMAFREAREQGEEVFEFMGEMYNTRTAEEEAAMDPAQLEKARLEALERAKAYRSR